MSTDIRTLLCTLETLTQQGYVFRGHESFKYLLQPNAFREQSIIQMQQNFGINPLVLRNWFNSNEIKRSISLWCSPDPIYTQHPTINRLKEFGLYLMLYNHALHLFVEENPSAVSEKDKARILMRDTAYWKQESTFQHLFERYLPTIITRIGLDSQFRQEANPYEDLAGVDETLPQHYDIPTAALDWTLDYHIALYFAVGERDDYESKFFTIYALKTDTKSSPIKILDRSKVIKNIRAERQQGTFSYFTNPCSFYLQHGTLPTINYFNQRYKNGLDEKTFELKEFVIERTPSNVSYLKTMLNEKGIDALYLLPELVCDLAAI